MSHTRSLPSAIIAMSWTGIQAGDFTTWGNDKGIDIFLDYSAEVISNGSGGERTGTGYNGLSSFGLHFYASLL